MSKPLKMSLKEIKEMLSTPKWEGVELGRVCSLWEGSGR